MHPDQYMDCVSHVILLCLRTCMLLFAVACFDTRGGAATPTRPARESCVLPDYQTHRRCKTTTMAGGRMLRCLWSCGGGRSSSLHAVLHGRQFPSEIS